jgi:hypothetical protein
MQEKQHFGGAGSLGYSVVEFVGGPVDGLRIVEGIENFRPSVPGELVQNIYSIDGFSATYLPRVAAENGTLFLDLYRT